MKKIFAAAAAAALILTAGCAADETAQQPDVNVFIAASLANAMNEIADNYKSDGGSANILYNADSSGTLMTQIQEGAECDIFFSAAEKQMNELNSDGYIKSETITPLLENKVVLIKPAGTQTSVTGFDNITEAKSIALAGEDVPVGSYAREIFKTLGITDDVMNMTINECSNVTTVLTAVAEGANEIGIVYSTDAASMSDKVDVIASADPELMSTPVVYPVALTVNEKADEKQQTAAEDFYNYLKSDEAEAVFEKYGFDMNK